MTNCGVNGALCSAPSQKVLEEAQHLQWFYSMTRYIVRRLWSLVPVLFGISLLVFVIPRMIPGDPATLILGQRATPASLAQLREQLGLGKPWFLNFEAARERGIAGLFDSQYLNFVGNALTGDLGRSIQRRTQVLQELQSRFPATFELAVAGMLFALLLGIPAGILAALNRGKWPDTALMFVALSGVSFPIFWLALILIYVFGVYLRWLPPSGRIDPQLDINAVRITGLYVLDGILRGQVGFSWNAIKHLVLPAIALGSIPLAIIVRMTRSSMLETLSQDYIRTARAKGLVRSVVINKHAFRNALLPVVTVIGLSFGGLLSGAILTETVFAWPGIGKWVYDAIASRDYPIIQGGVLFVACIFVLVNLIVDISYAFIDPRIQYG
jgi:ABC-type dipeptide/oligopeptide/nickel transport system permease component